MKAIQLLLIFQIFLIIAIILISRLGIVMIVRIRFCSPDGSSRLVAESVSGEDDDVKTTHWYKLT